MTKPIRQIYIGKWTRQRSLAIVALLAVGFSYLFFGEGLRTLRANYQSKPFRANCYSHLTSNFEVEIRRFPGGWDNIRGIGVSAFIREYCNCVSDRLSQANFPFAEFTEKRWSQQRGVSFTSFAAWSRSNEGFSSIQRCALQAEEIGRRYDPQLGKVIVLDKQKKLPPKIGH